ILERIDEMLARAVQAQQHADEALTSLVSLLGCSKEEGQLFAEALGFRRFVGKGADADGAEPKPVWQHLAIQRRRSGKRGQKRPSARRDSPFAKLAQFMPAD